MAGMDAKIESLLRGQIVIEETVDKNGLNVYRYRTPLGEFTDFFHALMVLDEHYKEFGLVPCRAKNDFVFTPTTVTRMRAEIEKIDYTTIDGTLRTAFKVAPEHSRAAYDTEDEALRSLVRSRIREQPAEPPAPTFMEELAEVF